MPASVDVLVVSLDTTAGWRSAMTELVESFRRAGASVQRASAGPVPTVRTFAATDYVQARAARGAAESAIAAHRPRAIVYGSITAALLWPRPGAISLDSIAAENRPGRHGIWQRPVERRRLRETPLILGWSARSLDPLRTPHAEMLVVPPPIDLPEVKENARDLAAVTYAGDPVKRRLPVVLDAWRRARREGETLVVVGTDSVQSSEGVQVAGMLSAAEFSTLLLRARTFISAPRREDFGIAALEALAHGCMLVGTVSAGPYPAREIASSLDRRLVVAADAGLEHAIRSALDSPVDGYWPRAVELLEPYTRESLDRRIAQDVLPRLVGP